jgi:hypothetical protein
MIVVVVVVVVVANNLLGQEKERQSILDAGSSSSSSSSSMDLLSSSSSNRNTINNKKSHHADVIRQLLEELDASLEGRVIYSSSSHMEEEEEGNNNNENDDDHDDAFHVWSHQIDDQRLPPPIAIVQVQSEQDVVLAVKVLAQLDAEHQIPFRIQSGGHHYDGRSSVASGIVLSLRRLNSISIDDFHNNNNNNNNNNNDGSSSNAAVATIGPGALVIDVLEQVLQPHSYGAVVGACPSVGEGGYILGGGFSYYSRLHGLGVDNVLEMRVVLASGTLVTASISRHPDLFWAMLGAGSAGYGVVTSFKYRLFPSQDKQLYGQGALPSNNNNNIKQFKASELEICLEMPWSCSFYFHCISALGAGTLHR